MTTKTKETHLRTATDPETFRKKVSVQLDLQAWGYVAFALKGMAEQVEEITRETGKTPPSMREAKIQLEMAISAITKVIGQYDQHFESVLNERRVLDEDA